MKILPSQTSTPWYVKKISRSLFSVRVAFFGKPSGGAMPNSENTFLSLRGVRLIAASKSAVVIVKYECRRASSVRAVARSSAGYTMRRRFPPFDFDLTSAAGGWAASPAASGSISAETDPEATPMIETRRKIVTQRIIPLPHLQQPPLAAPGWGRGSPFFPMQRRGGASFYPCINTSRFTNGQKGGVRRDPIFFPPFVGSGDDVHAAPTPRLP